MQIWVWHNWEEILIHLYDTFRLFFLLKSDRWTRRNIKGSRLRTASDAIGAPDQTRNAYVAWWDTLSYQYERQGNETIVARLIFVDIGVSYHVHSCPSSHSYSPLDFGNRRSFFPIIMLFCHFYSILQSSSSMRFLTFSGTLNPAVGNYSNYCIYRNHGRYEMYKGNPLCY